jgi:hypothetical protein
MKVDCESNMSKVTTLTDDTLIPMTIVRNYWPASITDRADILRSFCNRLIVFHPDPEHTDRQIAYTMQARCSGVTPGDVSSELLELSKGWKLPAFQTQGPGK